MRLVNINSTDVRGTLLKLEGLSQDRVWSSLQRILEDTALCAFATVTTDNRAHINTAYFAYSDELEVYFLSHPNSAHCRNVSGNASMAIAVFSSSQNWVGPDLGAQLFGFSNRAEDCETSNAEQAYIRRFPKYADWKKGLAPGDPALEYCLFRFATNRLKILDEGEFGEAIFVHADVVGLRSDLRHSHG